MQKVKNEILTKWKIAIGYLLLLAVLFFSLIFIYSEMKSFSSSDVDRHSKADSLLLLLHQKDKNTISILRMLDDVNDSALSIKEVDRIIARQDSVLTQQRVQHRVITKRDSLITPPKKRGFFKRLIEVFAPSKDSAVLVNTSLEFRTDTLLEDYNPVDSLHRQIHEIKRKKRQLSKIKNDNSKLLHQTNRRLSVKIDSLIKNYDQETSLRVMQKVEESHQVGTRSIKTIGVIAVVAVVLSIFFLILIWRDITRSNKYRKQLEAANRRAEELLEAREKLMLTITHDFKAPLGSIIGYADLISDVEVDKRQKSYLKNMKDSSKHLLRLVNDLLDFHRLDLNKMEINRVFFNLIELFDELQITFAPLAQTKGLLLSWDVSRDLDGLFIGDPVRLRQITENLLSNAIKFTEYGSVKVSVAYVASSLKLVVADTGKGMDAADKERIFQEFTRLPGAQGQEGFGLGLSIVYKLVHLLNGNIDVESVKGEGSTFIVTLPLDVSDETHPDIAFNALSADHLKILLIDDDRIQLTLTAAMLEQQGLSATCCEQLEELTEHLRNEHFDFLLTDVQMPSINGIDLLKLLRASNITQAKEIPVIAVTARSEMSEASFKEQGFFACLHKPFSIKELLRALCLEAREINSSIFSMPDNSDLSIKFNFASLLTFSGDDKEAARNIMDSFITETGKNITQMDEALQNKDVTTISSLAHKLLPLFTLLEASEALPLLSWLELRRDDAFSSEVERQILLFLDNAHSILQQAEIFRNQL